MTTINAVRVLMWTSVLGLFRLYACSDRRPLTLSIITHEVKVGMKLSAFEITYVVSDGALNSTHSLTM